MDKCKIDPESYQLNFNCYYSLYKYKKAERMKNLISDCQESKSSLKVLYKWALHNGDFKEAEKIIDKMYKYDPYNASLMIRKAKLYKYMGLFEKSKKLFKKAIKYLTQTPNYLNNYSILNNLAVCYLHLRNYEKEILTYRDMLKLNNKSIYTLKSIADSLDEYENDGKQYYEKLLNVINESLKKNPKIGFLYKMKAKTLYKLQNYRKAITFFEKNS